MEKDSIQSLAEKYLSDKNEYNFKLLYNRIIKNLKLYINSFITTDIYNRYDLVNDILSDVFYKFLTKLNTYNNNWNISTWIYAIAKNETLCKIQYERNTLHFGSEDYNDLKYSINAKTGKDYSNFSTTLFEFKHPMIAEEETNLNNQLYENIIEKIFSLPSKYKDIIYDRIICAMSYDEIADKYFLPMQTIKNRIRIGKEKLNTLIDDSNLKKLYNFIKE